MHRKIYYKRISFITQYSPSSECGFIISFICSEENHLYLTYKILKEIPRLVEEWRMHALTEPYIKVIRPLVYTKTTRP